MDTSDITGFINTLGTSAANSGLDPWQLLAGFYDTIEVRTTAAPPVKISIRDLGGAPSPISQYLKPTIIFTGNSGRYAIAPYGEASAVAGWATSLGTLAAIAGVGFLLGRMTR